MSVHATLPCACVCMYVCVGGGGTLLQPLLPANHFLQPYFLDQWYAVAVPAGLLLAAIAFVFSFVTSVLRKAAQKKKGA
jgi:hypothetical protein